MEVSGLFVYPLKSAGGLPLLEAELDTTGIRGDRRWAVAAEDGRILTQRRHPVLATVRAEPRGGGLRVRAPDRPPLILEPPPETDPTITVHLRGTPCEARETAEEAAAWFTGLLGEACRPVWMPRGAARPVDPRWARPGDRVGFADGFPLLLVGTGSLAALNRRLDHPVPMDRFRPNLVVSGAGPFAEDGWRRIRVGEVTLRIVKACPRCVVTTVDQSSGERGAEPLRTLHEFRRGDDGRPLFGQNAIHDGPGRLRRGDPVEVLE